MNLNKLKYIHFLFILIIICLFMACTPQSSYGIKSFLFDGVPNPNKVEITAIQDSVQVVDSTLMNQTPVNPLVRNQFNLHVPYEERKCSSCHDRNSMGQTKLPIPELCNQCHEDFNNSYAVLHGPVAFGACLQCHSPHQSKLENLLVSSGQDLCLNCHDSAKVFTYKIHENIEDTNCTECHNPHGGNNRFNLQSGTCYKCHDSYEKKFKFVHGPVASENCTQCHVNHESKTKKLLKQTGNALCFNCHSSETVLASKTHLKVKNENCTKCHDPHGGSTSELLLVKR